ncbi:YadA-like family protein [uncultured Sneathia sp.]|uniref:YadA-like family protein n=1 Tax=uncultured Sneathia sp. TaxID=278067 RepID=UPI002805F736|nr:YadA-like family protein [uncultured Sneathia sp.]
MKRTIFTLLIFLASITFADGETKGYEAGEGSAKGNEAIAIGKGAKANEQYSIAIGKDASTNNATTQGDKKNNIEIISDKSIAIGYSSKTTGRDGVAIGSSAKVIGQEGVAIGTDSSSESTAVAIGGLADATKGTSVAIGYMSKADEPMTVSVGRVENKKTGKGAYRRIVNLDDGKNPNDAPTMRQLVYATAIQVSADKTSDMAYLSKDGNNNITHVGFNVLKIYGKNGISTEVNNNGEITISLKNGNLGNNNEEISQIKDDIKSIDKKSDLALSGVSNAVAMANLPNVSGDRKFNLAASYGYYGGSHAVAVGFSGINDKQNFTYKLSGAVNSKGNLAFGVGAGFMLGSVNNRLQEENMKLKSDVENLKNQVKELYKLLKR